MPQAPWPHTWQRLRDEGRLQFRWLAQSSQWLATVPELGLQIRCGSARALVEQLAPHVNRLPRTAQPERVNGFKWPEPLPAAKNLLPRR